MKEKNILVTRRCVIQMFDFETSNSKWTFKFVENAFFLENYATSEGAVSHTLLYYQPLPITR